MNYSILQFTTRRVIAAKDQLIHNIYIYIFIINHRNRRNHNVHQKSGIGGKS